MALSNLFQTKKNSLKIKTYSVDIGTVLGQGAFGVVYKGTDPKKNLIAAKRIDGKEHPRILTQDLKRFKGNDHENVLKILDTDRKDDIVWLIMPFCEMGDLNAFYRKKEVSTETSLDVMTQIISGVEYLHGRNIIHRDVKPGNILVASANPLLIKLTDFDVSKCLDPEVETSLMTSNVGTLAFKAPEFFQRTQGGMIEYHRNVDIYACGLTFLAILQAKKGNKMLIPRIETPQHDSELHAPSIGQLISERIKYKVSELNIVLIQEDPVKEDKKSPMVRKLIKQMTCMPPEARLSAEGVFKSLVELQADHGPEPIRLDAATNDLEMSHKSLVESQPHSGPEPTRLDTASNALELPVKSLLEFLPHKGQDAVTNALNPPVDKVQLVRTHTWKIKTDDSDRRITVDLSLNDLLLLRQSQEKKKWIQVLNRLTGDIIYEVASHCDHVVCHIRGHPTDKNIILESCSQCAVIRAYGIKTETCKTVCTGFEIIRMCAGTSSSVLALDKWGRLLQFDWTQDGNLLRIAKYVNMAAAFQGRLKIRRIFYMEQNDLLVFTTRKTTLEPFNVRAMKLKDIWDGRTGIHWKLSGIVKPSTLACDNDGNIYVSDTETQKVLVLESSSGKPVKTISPQGVERTIYNIRWSRSQPHLTVHHDVDMISCYNVQ